jgi:hypothetical protein
LIQKWPDGIAAARPFRFPARLGLPGIRSEEGNGAPHPFSPDFPMLGFKDGRSTLRLA